MNLTSDYPFWTIRNELAQTFPPLDRNARCDALIVGGGISGALLLHELSKRGVDVLLIDRRQPGFGSTSASTALLQYDIDTPLRELRTMVGEAAAVRAYAMGVDSIHRLRVLAGDNCCFKVRHSLRVARQAREAGGLKRESELRQKFDLPAEQLSRTDLKARGIQGPIGLLSTIAAEVDPYRLTHRLLRASQRRGARIFARTAASHYDYSRGRVVTKVSEGSTIRSKAIFFATGYETDDILPPGLLHLKSTYAFVSEPVDSAAFWTQRTLLWDTGDPYLYARSTDDNRVIVGGADDRVRIPERRDAQLPRKTQELKRRFEKLVPGIEVQPCFSWAGVFGSTKDGLSYIGPYAKFPGAYFALGFGGNGITFAEIASQILADQFLGKKNADAQIFRFDR